MSLSNCHNCRWCLKQDRKLKMKAGWIIRAVEENDVNLLKALLNSPKWYKITDQDKYPLLSSAILRHSQEVVDFLLSLPNYPLEAVDRDGNTALMTSLADDYIYYNDDDGDENQIKEYYAIKLIEKGANFHQVHSSGSTLLHIALENSLIEVAELLIKKGIDVSKQDSNGDTPLHICFTEFFDDYVLVEGVSMLLFHGINPMISNCKGLTSFDLILMSSYLTPTTTEEIVRNYILGQYEGYDINAEAFLKATELDLSIFYEIVKNTREVIFCDNVTNGYISMIFTMKTHFLQIIIEEFDYVIEKLLCMDYSSFTFGEKPILIENFYVLMKSKLKLEFTDWLCNVDMKGVIGNVLSLRNRDLSAVQGLICFLLSYGMRIFERDLETVYRAVGYSDLFKILLHMDVEKVLSDPMRDIMPYIFYNVTLDVLKMIFNKNKLFPVQFSIQDLRGLLPYYTIPADFLRDGSLEHVQDEPRVPLLVELSRNVFRRYFIEQLNISNAKQFYTLIQLLPISRYHKRIITLETKLY